MKFTCSVDIDLPRSKVTELFDDPEYMKYWQDGFVSHEQVKGARGELGAQANITYKMGRKSMVLHETITKSALPYERHGLFEGDFGRNTMNNFFEELEVNKTRWRADMEYLQANGFMMKVMTKLFPGVMRKQTQKWMDQFKKFAEEKTRSI